MVLRCMFMAMGVVLIDDPMDIEDSADEVAVAVG